MEKKYNWSKKYDPSSKEPYVLSRSKIDLFLNCKRCFYLDRRLGIKTPSTLPFTLNIAIDGLLKKEFDIAREKGVQHEYCKESKINAIPYKHPELDAWRENFKGIRHHHKSTNFIIAGAMDDIWENQDNKKKHVVDYKVTSTKEFEKFKYLGMPWHQHYKNQLSIYGWLMKHNEVDVHEIGYFLYFNGKKDVDRFEGKLAFDYQIIPYELDMSWIDDTLMKIKDFLETKKIPTYDPKCDNCRYLKENNQVVSKLLDKSLSFLKEGSAE